MLLWRRPTPEPTGEQLWNRCLAETLTDYNAYTMTQREKTRYFVVAWIVIFAIGLAFFNNVFIAGFISLGAIKYPEYASKGLAERRKGELLLQFKDALYTIGSALGAGSSLENSFRGALRDLAMIYTEQDAAILQELRQISRGLELNQTIEVLLLDFAERSGLQDVKNFADVLITCKRTGGNLVQVVKTTANIINEKIDITHEIELALARKKFEQKVLNTTPFVFLGLLRFGGGGYMDALYASPTGYILMGLALTLLVGAGILSKRILNIEV